METKPVLDNGGASSPSKFDVLKLTEQKIGALREALYLDDSPQNMSTAQSLSNAVYSMNPMHAKVVELKALSARYNNGEITIEEYNEKLDQLLSFVNAKVSAFKIAF
jgi:hypothetical protein